ncbi:acetyl-CoA hydrolase/transferase family protein [Nocardia sp. NPDC050175]|uniref:acetyl-CoA hydrolase/transferase family protein n=1 Tax=Nocardia sp. NPDC050175 TaxID=3364317 RepID=UPI00378FCCEA
MAATIAADELDFRDYVRPGDNLTWGQATAEPVTLTENLLRQRENLGGITCFIGITVADTVRPEHADHIRFVSYCGTGSNRALMRAGALDIYPGHYSSLPGLLTRGALATDVVLVQCSPADDQGRYSLGIAADYYAAAIDSARVVIAEVNDQVPFTYGQRYLTAADVDVVVHSARPPVQQQATPIGAQVRQVAAKAAELIEDGSTLQFGIGAVPEAVLAALGDKRDLGIHSGVLNDVAADLIEHGVVTNARKSVDRGVSVGGLLLGTRRLFDFAHRNPAVAVRPTSYTHDANLLAAQHNLVAINSAIEVDLTGQVNAEVAGGTYVGAVGGGAEFLRGAARSRGGIPIVALPSTASERSRIVAELSGPVSTSRADAGVFVTEYGVADLRGRTLAERQALMLTIAHPDHRKTLEEKLCGEP